MSTLRKSASGCVAAKCAISMLVSWYSLLCSTSPAKSSRRSRKTRGMRATSWTPEQTATASQRLTLAVGCQDLGTVRGAVRAARAARAAPDALNAGAEARGGHEVAALVGLRAEGAATNGLASRHIASKPSSRRVLSVTRPDGPAPMTVTSLVEEGPPSCAAARRRGGVLRAPRVGGAAETKNAEPRDGGGADAPGTRGGEPVPSGAPWKARAVAQPGRKRRRCCCGCSARSRSATPRRRSRRR